MATNWDDLWARWHGKSVAYSEAPLTAALIYERVLIPPDALGVEALVSSENRFRYGMRFGEEPDKKEGLLLGFNIGRNDDSLLEFAVIQSIHHTRYSEVASTFTAHTGALLVPVFGGPTDFEQEFRKGERSVIIAALSDLAVVDESQLTLPQVLEFRRDIAAARKYREMARWLDDAMAAKSQQEIVDTLAKKLDAYTWAVRKHGLKTLTGTISEALDGKYLLGASGVMSTFVLAGHPTLGFLAGAGLSLGKVAVKLTADMLDFKDLAKQQGPEIAWVIEVQKRFPAG